MTNEYSSQWFSTFLDPIPREWTSAEIAGVTRFLPLADFSRVLDICCGPGRHASPLVEQGYLVTGVDRDATAIATARQRAPTATFLELDQRELACVDDTFDAALILWQSFGYCDPTTNDDVLAAIAERLRPGGRLLLDLYHPRFVRAHAGTTSSPLAPDCRPSPTRSSGTGSVRCDDPTRTRTPWGLWAGEDHRPSRK